MPCLLFVDDDREIRRALGALLQRHGFEVRGAGSGEEALAALEAPGNEEIDAVLLDVRLPGIDGFETCRRIRQLARPALPVLMLTAYGDANALRQGAEAGADDFLVKPPDTPLLLLKVRALVRHKELHDQIERSQLEAQGRARDLALLHDIGRDWSLIAEPEAFHRMVTERLAQLIGAPVCVVAHYDAGSRTMTAAVPAFGLEDEEARSLSFALTPETGLLSFDAGRAYVSNEARGDPRLRSLVASRPRLQSLVLVPMLSEGVLLGLIAAANKPGGFREGDVLLLSLFAGPAATFVRGRQLFDRQRRHAARLEKLAALTGELSSARSRSALLGLTVERARTDLGCLRAAFYALGEDGQPWLVSEAGDDGAAQDPDLLRWALRGSGPLQEGAAGVVRLAVPVASGGRVHGLLCFTRRGAPFAEEELSVFTALAGHLAVSLEKAESVAETERLARQMTTLYDLGLETAAQRDLQKLFRRAAEEAGRLIGSDYTSVLRLDGEELRLFTAWSRAPMPAGAASPVFALGEGVAGRVARDGLPAMVNEPEGCADFLPRERPVARLLCLPLTYFDQEQRRVAVFGVLNATRQAGGPPFTDDDLEYLTRFASQLSIAAANSVAFTRERERSEQLALVNSLLREMAGSLSRGRILQTAVARIREALPATAVLIGLVDPESGQIEIAAAAADAVPAESWASQPREAGLFGRALRERRSQAVPDLAREPTHVRRVAGARSLLVVPILSGDEAIGVLDVESPRLGEFSRNEVLTLETLADGIGILLRNAELYQALEQTNARLVDMDRWKSELVNMVAHDFRAPLTSVLGYTDLIELGDESLESRQQFARAIRESIRHLAQLVDKTLKSTRLETGQLPFDFGLCDLGAVVREVAGRQPVEMAARLRLDLPEEPLPCWADRDRLVELVENLVSNGAKYSDATRPVEVSLTRHGDGVTLAVSDQGVGIAEEDLARLFKPFSRIQRADAPRVPGTGLGLYICERIVRAHGGRLQVASRPGLGSTFSATLPLFGLAAQRRAPLVLVAAADPATRRQVRRAAEAVGFGVHEAADGVEALELALRLQPRAVVLDSVLPHLRAEDLAERLEAQPSTAGVALLALAAPEALGRSAARFKACLPKPLEHAVLCAALEEVLLGAPRDPSLAEG